VRPHRGAGANRLTPALTDASGDNRPAGETGAWAGGGPTGASTTPAFTVPSSMGVQVALHDLGGNGPATLFAHATGFHGLVWQPCAARLPRLHGWAPDLRGHGDSTLPPETTDTLPLENVVAWDRFADDVLATVDAVRAAGDDTGPLFGVGHSKGGAALLLAEQRRPGTFRALYLYEPIVFPDHVVETMGGENPLAAGALRRRDRFDSYEHAEANFAAKPPFDALDPDVLHAYVQHGFAPGEDGSVHLKCRPTTEAEVYRQGMRHHAFAHLHEVRCPVVVAAGVDDGYGPATLAPLIVEALPTGRLDRHPELGHFGPLEHPEVLAEAIAAAFSI
jgi:pimeloyl-ACP methyl ester carboxylesterase